jgi:ORF6N domain
MPAKKPSPKKPAKQPASAAISTTLIPEQLAPLVIRIRRENVILDSDIAELYGVKTKELNRAVKRNIERFPADFMFQLTEEEQQNLKSQIVTSSLMPQNETVKKNHLTSQPDDNLKCQIGTSSSHGGRRTLPYAFTEQGVAMLSSVLRSQRAVEVNIAIMRTFVQLRSLMQSNKLLAEKIEALENKYDQNFQIVFDAIKQLISTDQKSNNKELGFHTISKK